MGNHPLDNPVWSSLTTRQASLAVMQELAGRYPPQVAPFAAVGEADAASASQLEALINPGESVYFVGLAPRLERGWQTEPHGVIPQLVCESPVVVRPGPEPATLGEANRSDML